MYLLNQNKYWLQTISTLDSARHLNIINYVLHGMNTYKSILTTFASFLVVVVGCIFF